MISYWRKRTTTWTVFNDDNSASNVERRLWSERWRLYSIGDCTCEERGILQQEKKKNMKKNLGNIVSLLSRS